MYHLSMAEMNAGTLTERERMVLQLIGTGFSNKEAATHMYVSVETIKKHLQNAYRKLNARNRIEALRQAGII